MTEVDRYLDAATRQNTVRSYASALRHFEVEWQGHLPATPDSIARYLAAYAQTLATSTLRHRLAAIASWHRDHGFVDPTRSPLVRKVFKGIQTLHPGQVKQAAPLQIRRLVELDDWLAAAIAAAHARGDGAAALRYQRDRALVLLGFWRGFRGDELLRLEVAHLTLVPGQGMTCFLPRSKGDRQAAGVTYKVPALSRLCPVEATQAWLQAADLQEGPLFAPKDKIGDWLEMYTKVMEVNYWSSTNCVKARYDAARKEWEVTVERDGETLVIRPKHLVFATGMSGKANVPKIEGQDVFKGVQQHSSQHPGPDAYRGKKVVVIGANNSAHDICAALWEHGADVTMVQRSSTHIVRSDSLMDIGLGDLYSERAVANGVTTKKADLIFASLPYRIMADFQIPLYDRIRERDAEFYRKLKEAGFMLDFGDDGSGLFMKYLRRASGYYIDVGACDLVIDGSIKLQSGKDISHLTENAVVLDDGTELPADLVVYATGYGSMNGWVADLVSQEVADKVGKVWGLGSDTTKDPGPWEGEQRNMWKPTQQENMWFHGGNLHQSRHYSL
ncbi:TPA: NAD(P)-binding domain-containing protein [Stenotrophomonas maltophilia]|uniref:NAD(P)-binding domain-containing protein n=2 Tax=Lysobacteraceae TaxID=32033 RepID=UPI000B30541E|nr:NAD(P)-binding domain-containing protein [Stenotrophomonas maltophilia]